MKAISQEQPGSFSELRHDDAAVMSPGALLRDRRLALRLNEWDVAREMRLQTQYILDLEADNFAAFSSLAFVRGYLRGYAKLVGIAEAEVMQLFNQLSLQEKPVTGVPKYITQDKGQGDRYWRWMGLVVIAFVIASLILWWQNRGTSLYTLNTSVNTTLSKVSALQHNLQVEAAQAQAEAQAQAQAQAAAAQATSSTVQTEQALGASGSLLNGMSTDTSTQNPANTMATADTTTTVGDPATNSNSASATTSNPSRHHQSSSLHAPVVDAQGSRF